MSRFDKGDRVKVMQLTVEESDGQAMLARRYVGHIGIVSNVSIVTRDDPYGVEVLFEDDHSLWFSPDELDGAPDA